MIMFSLFDYQNHKDMESELFALLPRKEQARIESTGSAELRTERTFAYALFYALLSLPDETSLKEACVGVYIKEFELAELAREGVALAPEIMRTESGKPYFDKEVEGRTPSKIHFSISHSETVVAAVISDMRVGIDVQKHIEVNEDALREKFSLPDGIFWNKWTCREATAKIYDIPFAKAGDLAKISSYFIYKISDDNGAPYTLTVAI